MSKGEVVELLADGIIRDQVQIDNLYNHIKDLYQQITDSFSVSSGVVTKDIERLYKEIDATFGKKTKLEQNVNAAKRQIFSELGVK